MAENQTRYSFNQRQELTQIVRANVTSQLAKIDGISAPEEYRRAFQYYAMLQNTDSMECLTQTQLNYIQTNNATLLENKSLRNIFLSNRNASGSFWNRCVNAFQSVFQKPSYNPFAKYATFSTLAIAGCLTSFLPYSNSKQQDVVSQTQQDQVVSPQEIRETSKYSPLEKMVSPQIPKQVGTIYGYGPGAHFPKIREATKSSGEYNQVRFNEIYQVDDGTESGRMLFRAYTKKGKYLGIVSYLLEDKEKNYRNQNNRKS